MDLKYTIMAREKQRYPDLLRTALSCIETISTPGSRLVDEIKKSLKTVNVEWINNVDFYVEEYAGVDNWKMNIVVQMCSFGTKPIRFSIPITRSLFMIPIYSMKVTVPWNQITVRVVRGDEDARYTYISNEWFDKASNRLAELRKKFETASDRQDDINDDAIDAAVAWWAKQLSPGHNYGMLADLGGMQAVFATVLANNQEKPLVDAVDDFKRELKNIIIEKIKSDHPLIMFLDVDYGPCFMLGEAMARSGIKFELPWKTNMWIEMNPWSVSVSKGLNAREEHLYETRQSLLKEVDRIEKESRKAREKNALFNQLFPVGNVKKKEK